MRRPIRRFKPIALIQEERLRQDTTANEKVCSVIWWAGTVPGDPCSHLSQASSTVCFLKSIPGKPTRQSVCPGKNATAHDRTIGCVQSEQEKLTGGERAKSSRRWSPEVHLIEAGLTGQILKPIRGSVSATTSLTGMRCSYRGATHDA